VFSGTRGSQVRALPRKKLFARFALFKPFWHDKSPSRPVQRLFPPMPRTSVKQSTSSPNCDPTFSPVYTRSNIAKSIFFRLRSTVQFARHSLSPPPSSEPRRDIRTSDVLPSESLATHVFHSSIRIYPSSLVLLFVMGCCLL
jgi:hypothetical protein